MNCKNYMKSIYFVLVLASFNFVQASYKDASRKQVSKNCDVTSAIALKAFVRNIRNFQPSDDIEGDIATYVQVFGPNFLKQKHDGQSILQIAEESGNYRAVRVLSSLQR